MTDAPPRWVRAVVTVSRAASFGGNVVMLFCGELLCARVTPGGRDRVTSWIYANQKVFLRGGSDFDVGLLDWEERITTGPLFPRAGRILLGAAGGGREMLPLAERGYQIVAFEPSPLYRGAAEVAARFPNVQVVRASYADLVRSVEAGIGPLADAARGSFDAVILGWGSLSHVTDDQDRIALLRAIRRIAPSAPVVLSFFRGAHTQTGPLERVRRLIQWMLRPLGSEVGSRLRFSMAFGFLRPLMLDDVQTLAADAGYHLLNPDGVKLGYAMLLPQKPVGG